MANDFLSFLEKYVIYIYGIIYKHYNMNNKKLWSKEAEKLFFNEYGDFTSEDKLFYELEDNRLLSYYPKDYKGHKNTLQSRNTLIGKFTEKYTLDLIKSLITDDRLYAVQSVQSPEIGLTRYSPADIAITTKNSNILKPSEIEMIFEVKMSLLWNWELNKHTETLIEKGDYTTHTGNPSLLRSDSMLKAIGKCVNIRISNKYSTKIPLVVIGNSPISKSYQNKVDKLKKSGIIQGFWSITPKPLNNNKTLKKTPNKGFIRFDDISEFKEAIDKLLYKDLNFFSGMTTPDNLGKIIELSDEEKTYEDKGIKFLKLLNGDYDG